MIQGYNSLRYVGYYIPAVMASLGAASVEYTTLKESLGDFIDCLLGNVPVITLLSTELYTSYLIPKAINVDAQDIHLPASARANKILSSVLKTLETHRNPSEVFSSLITVLHNVGLNDIATQLEERLGE